MSGGNYTVAIVGNPNCGKTTLFNAMTGSREYVGNWPGVTVDKIIGSTKCGEDRITLIDLPGVYSLDATTPEEKVTSDYLSSEDFDFVINVVDSTCLERSLGLTLELVRRGIPLIIALNMTDELERTGSKANTDVLHRMLGVDSVRISAKSGLGTDFLNKELNYKLRNGELSKNKKNVKASAKEIAAQVIGSTDYGKKQIKIDRFLTKRKYSAPFFIICTFLVFYITFGRLGTVLSSLLDWFCRVPLDFAVSGILRYFGASKTVESLVREGIVSGVGGVVAFLPQIMLLFTMIAVLEESGLMARSAYCFDPLFRKTGLSGKAFIPFAVGFGCSVPAVMSTRAQDSERDRIALASFVPFVPCSARIPVFALIFGTFFPSHTGIATALMYVLGIGMSLMFSAVLRRIKAGKVPEPFLMELPPIRIPDAVSVFSSAWRRVRGFVMKAGTVIFVCSVTAWVLEHYTLTMTPATIPDESILFQIGKTVSPLLRPIGLGSPPIVSALLSGAVAKESAVSTLEILAFGSTKELLSVSLNRASALSLAVFILFYCPCVATFNVLSKELGGLINAVKLSLFYLIFAYAVSFIVYRIGIILF